MSSIDRWALLLAVSCLVLGPGCGGQSDFPDPYAGYAHSRSGTVTGKIPETSRTTDDTKLIGELHLHDGAFSVTYQPFETYKDYWGTYEWNQADGTIELKISEGNIKPEPSTASARPVSLITTPWSFPSLR